MNSIWETVTQINEKTYTYVSLLLETTVTELIGEGARSPFVPISRLTVEIKDLVRAKNEIAEQFALLREGNPWRKVHGLAEYKVLRRMCELDREAFAKNVSEPMPDNELFDTMSLLTEMQELLMSLRQHPDLYNE